MAANEQIASPAPVGAGDPVFSRDAHGALCLRWNKASGAVGSAVFDPAKKIWEPQTAAPSAPEQALHRLENGGRILTAEGGRQAAVWLDESSEGRRLLLSVSVDAGAHFLLPVQIDDGHPYGTPDLLLLADGTVFSGWAERAGDGKDVQFWLRRISPGGSLSVPIFIGTASTPSPAVHLARVDEPDGGLIRLLAAFSDGEADTAHIVVRLIAVEPATNLARRNPCNCPDDDETAASYALRGVIIALAPERGTVSLRHSAIPGVLDEGVDEFKVDASFFQQGKTGGELLARIEKKGNDWWLLSPRLLVRPQK